MTILLPFLLVMLAQNGTQEAPKPPAIYWIHTPADSTPQSSGGTSWTTMVNQVICEIEAKEEDDGVVTIQINLRRLTQQGIKSVPVAQIINKKVGVDNGGFKHFCGTAVSKLPPEARKLAPEFFKLASEK